MKKSLILGLILTSVLLIGIIGVSAQEITGDVVMAGDDFCSTCSCDGQACKECSKCDSTSIKRAPRGMTATTAADGTTCYNYKKEARTNVKIRKSGGVIRWWGNGQVVINDNGDIVLTQN